MLIYRRKIGEMIGNSYQDLCKLGMVTVTNYTKLIFVRSFPILPTLQYGFFDDSLNCVGGYTVVKNG